MEKVNTPKISAKKRKVELKFVEDAAYRRKSEKRHISSIQNVIGEMQIRTKTPAVFLAFSEGKIVAKASSSNLNKFISDPTVQELFTKYMMENNEGVEEEEESECEEEGGDEGFNYNSYWMDLNARQKRNYICQLMKWFNIGERNPWKKHLIPEWWPRDLKFQSPHAKTSRALVSDSNAIITAFENYHLPTLMNDVFEDPRKKIEEIKCETWEELCKKCHQLRKLLDYFDFERIKKEGYTSNMTNETLKSMLPDNNAMQPVKVNDGCFAKTISLSLWNSIEWWPILKLYGLSYIVLNLNTVLDFVNKGDFGYSSEDLTHLAVDVSVLKRHIMDSIITDKCDVLYLYGIVQSLNLALFTITDDQKYFKIFNRNNQPGVSNVYMINIHSTIHKENILAALATN